MLDKHGQALITCFHLHIINIEVIFLISMSKVAMQILHRQVVVLWNETGNPLWGQGLALWGF
jgi:hypothetical protein